MRVIILVTNISGRNKPYDNCITRILKSKQKRGNFMNEIIINNLNGSLTVSSLQVAKDFEKRHDKLVAEIERMYGELIGCTQNGGDPFFIEKSYQHPQNKQWYKSYELTRDGFSLLVMGFTGKKALEWKLKYIEAFNLMENKLRNSFNEINLESVLYRAKRWAGRLVPRFKELDPTAASVPELSLPPTTLLMIFTSIGISAKPMFMEILLSLNAPNPLRLLLTA